MSNLSPNSPPPLPPGAQAEDSTGGIIPYKNPRALVSYYTGIFSLIPLMGFILGCIAVPLGISGLKYRKLNPMSRGGVHAWVGIVCGSLSLLGHLLIIGVIVFASLHRR